MKKLYQFSFIGKSDLNQGYVFVIERSVEKAAVEATRKLAEEDYDKVFSEKDLVVTEGLRVHDDETVGVYEVIYPYMG